MGALEWFGRKSTYCFNLLANLILPLPRTCKDQNFKFAVRGGGQNDVFIQGKETYCQSVGED